MTGHDVEPAQGVAGGAAGPSLRRMHFRRDGRPKKPLTRRAAERARRLGMRTYLCPLCQATHAATTDQQRGSGRP